MNGNENSNEIINGNGIGNNEGRESRSPYFDYTTYSAKALEESALASGIQSQKKEKKHRQSALEDYGKLYVESIAQSRKKDSIDVVDTVVDYINQHLSEELSVRSLANMAYVSPDHLTRSFKKRFSMTVSDYILQRRMTLAGELLRDNKLTITMVSDCVGFGNYSYFTEQFKKYYGMTPREYQNSVRKT